MSTRTLPEPLAFAGMALLMLLSDVIALLLVSPVQNAGILAFDNPDTLWNIIVFLFVMLVVTAILLILIKYKAQKIISLILALCIAAVIFYIALSLLGPILPVITAYLISALVGIGMIVLLWVYPEWYIINIVGIITSAGCAVIFGVSLSPLPVIVLLILLIIYDFISVNHTKHMLTLADGVMKQKIPIMFLIPKTRHYSYRKTGMDITADKSERSAYMIGMGDMIMPGILAISAQVFVSGMTIFGISLPAIGTIVGSVIGLILLSIPMRSGKAQAGLPLINSCAIIGFLLCCLISGSWDWVAIGF
ncbi:MAG TPA: presenilin family intramembrane aspartyl protease [Methanocorpusculum sp.]|nr:presenilin family intramembrane aspartyl protease [Methanocorpusculum sp.]